MVKRLIPRVGNTLVGRRGVGANIALLSDSMNFALPGICHILPVFYWQAVIDMSFDLALVSSARDGT